MNAAHAEQSPPVTANEDVEQVRRRRQRIGMKITELAQEAGISRDTLSDLEAGNKRPHADTVEKVLVALERLETEMGMDAPPLPPGARYLGDPADDLIEFVIEGTDGIRAVVKGPIRNMEALQASAQKLIEGMQLRPPAENGA